MVFGIVCTFLLSSLLSLQVYADSRAADKKININTASLTELQKLPKIGEKMAKRIIDFREKNGKFKKIEEIMKVRGIAESIFKGLKDQITVETQTKKK